MPVVPATTETCHNIANTSYSAWECDVKTAQRKWVCSIITSQWRC